MTWIIVCDSDVYFPPGKTGAAGLDISAERLVHRRARLSQDGLGSASLVK